MPDAVPREIEFLPPDYAALRHRRRWLTIQGTAVGALFAAMTFHVWNVKAAARSTAAGLRQLSAAQDTHRKQEAAVAKISRHAQASRLLSTFDRAMPLTMALTEVNIESEPPVADVFPLAYLTQYGGSSPSRVRVQLRGQAATAVDGANFVAGLSKLPFLRQVTMTDAREGVSSEQAAVNEFRVTFWLDLNEGEESP